MDPSKIETPQAMLDRRAQAAKDKERLDNVLEEIEKERIRVVTKAIEVVDTLRIFFGDEYSPAGITRIIVTEKCNDEAVGEYAKLARIGLSLRNGSNHSKGDEYDPEQENVTVEIGHGFNSRPKMPIEGEDQLGYGSDNQAWYGVWDAGGKESTNLIESKVRKIKQHFDRDELEIMRTEILDKLASIGESLDIILEAAENRNLNPMPS